MDALADAAAAVGVDPAVAMLSQPAPLEQTVAEHVQPVLQGFTGDEGIPAFFASMPELVTVEQLRNGITKPEIKAKARGVIRMATLKSLARVIDPTGNFD